MNKVKNYNITYQSIIIALTIIIFIITLYTIDVLLLTFAAILLAIFLRTLNNFVQKVFSMPDSISISLVLISIVSLFTLMVLIMTPIINEQTEKLLEDIPSAWHKIKQLFGGSYSTLYKKLDIESFFPSGKNFLIQATNIFSSTFGLFGSVLVVLIMGIFFAYDPNVYVEGFISLIPSNKQKKIESTVESIAEILKWWIVGKTLSMIIVGFLTALGLFILNIPMALSLGLLAAILTFIPNIGPIISAVPAILIASIQSPMLVVYVIALYIIIQTIESYIITPLIQRKTISQPPALIIFSQLIMGLLTGFLGLSLATPLLAALSVIIEKHSNEESH